ncbi:ABC-F family ATP-binding cassette domain-containing protein [Alicyclobacillus ferrooxydans]|uniref:ABC transporter domain-containing protein n=1 Tax=Alicyclobacillus ferrooxydans TaxID=471514 RepID=A0A0P9CJR0_9BACL|nr:ABC-F family ATP-binding cassette domain-containing protein [Alicyclobacillus ferrooxydans]KPV45538.1 hypothetical protein AN477_00895 [Alicyclobacillus ferrooxydans]
MSLLNADNISYTFGDQLIFRSVSMKLSQHDHTGLVGANGAGKTTLLSLLSGERQPDEGKIEWLPETRIGYLEQHLNLNEDMTVRDVLRSAFAPLYDMERQMIDMADKMAAAEDVSEAEDVYKGERTRLDSYLRRFAELEEQLQQSGFYQVEIEIDRIAEGLGLSEIGLDKTVGYLSGGQKTKLALAVLLLQKPHALLLDEPTNYLDQQHVEWLATYLKNYPHAFVVISHDELFLQQVVNVVFHLEHHRVTRYPGDYRAFAAAYELRKNQVQTMYQQQQAEIRRLETYIQKNKVRASTAKQAKSREKRLEKTMENRIKPPKLAARPHFRFHFSKPASGTVMEATKLLVGYGDPLFPPLDLKLKQGQKVAVTGFNGIGKTTLLRTLLGQIPQLSGQVKLGDGVVVGYFEQEPKVDGVESAIERVWGAFPALTQREVRTGLAQCGLRGEQVFQAFKDLSGGEQSKVRLCQLMMRQANWLVLDEPTNHLDALAKEALRDALAKFPGTVLVVAHEPQFYEDWVTDVWDVSAWSNEEAGALGED